MRKILLYTLSAPLLIFGLVLDILKLPFLVLLIWPLWGFLDLLAVLKGDKSQIVEMMWATGTMGIWMWAQAVGVERHLEWRRC